MQINKSEIFIATSVFILIFSLALIYGVSGSSLKKELSSSNQALASSTIAFTKLRNEQYATVSGFSDFFVIRRVLLSSTTVAEKSDVMIPDNCHFAKKINQSSISDPAFIIPYFKDNTAFETIKEGKFSFWEVNCN